MENIIFDNLPEKTKSLILKLKTLHERGVDGERVTATEMLNKYLEANNLTLNAINDNEVKTYWFSYSGNKIWKQLLLDIYSNVVDVHTINFYVKNNNNNHIGFDLTAPQLAEMKIKFDVYKRAFKIEEEKLYYAFVHAQNIYPPTPRKDGDADDMRELTKEEVQEMLEEQKKRKSGFYKQVGLMSNAISKVGIQKRIGDEPIEM